MSYIAVEKIIEVLGQKFQSFKTEDGEVVFSQSSFGIGMGLAESSVRSIRKSKQLESKLGSSLSVRNLKLKARVGGSTQIITIVSMSELCEIVCILAERGHIRAKSMQQASFAIMLQQSVDVAYGVKRETSEYTESTGRLAISLERRELREMSGRITNPTIACNLYQVNNDLVYGSGHNRDSYKARDSEKKHHALKCLEMMQAGMKMAGMPLSEIVTLSHEMYEKRLNN